MTGLLIALPQGLSVSGVTMWAVRLVNGLAERGRATGLIVHPEGTARSRLDIPLHAGVRVLRLEDAPPLEQCGGDLSQYIPTYRAAVEELGRSGPVVLSPNLHGDCYGIAASLAMTMPDRVRVVGWQHSDIEYDTRLLLHFEPMIARFVGVSSAITTSLMERLSGRKADVVELPYGVADGPTRPARTRGPLRLIYTGRLEHEQKRVRALLHLSDALEARGVDHRLTIVGDGPAHAEIQAGASPRGARINVLGACPPAKVSQLLGESELFVLPSRYEGLSVSMLEAMAAGCVPVLARTRSGAMQAVESGYNGAIADVGPDASDEETGRALADAVVSVSRRGLAALAEAAQRTIAERFSIQQHVMRVMELLDEVAASPPRAWPANRPGAFTGIAAGGGSGSVPAEGPRLLAHLLEELAGREVIIHGAGQHTIQLASVLAASPARIVAIADDDPARHGSRLWNWPIISPAEANGTGATDLIISSWMHQDAIYARREVYESQGLRVHRIYPA